MPRTDQNQILEKQLMEAYSLKGELESQLLLSVDNPVAKLRLNSQIEEVTKQIKKLETELENRIGAFSVSTPLVARRFRVFLSYLHTTDAKVRHIYRRLQVDGFEPWFEPEEIISSSQRQHEIEQALEDSDLILIFLTSSVVEELQYAHPVLKLILDSIAKKAANSAIVVKLEECIVPEELSHLPCLQHTKDPVYERLYRELRKRADKEKLIVQSSTYRENRYLDAAMPQQVVPGISVELTVMVRLPDSPGLRDILASRPAKYKAKPEDVESEDFVVDFQRDAQGTIISPDLTIMLTTSDFEIEENERRRKIKLQPDWDSEPLTFLLKPLRAGELLIKIEVFAAKKICLASGFLLITGAEIGQSEKVVATLPYRTRGVELEELKEQSQSSSRLPTVSHKSHMPQTGTYLPREELKTKGSETQSEVPNLSKRVEAEASEIRQHSKDKNKSRALSSTSLPANPALRKKFVGPLLRRTTPLIGILFLVGTVVALGVLAGAVRPTLTPTPTAKAIDITPTATIPLTTEAGLTPTLDSSLTPVVTPTPTIIQNLTPTVITQNTPSTLSIAPNVPTNTPAPSLVIHGIGTSRRGDTEIAQPADVTSEFTVGETVYIYLHVDLAQAEQDKVEITLVQNNNPQPPKIYTLAKQSGFIFFPFNQLEAGKYKVEVRYNGNLMANQPEFKVSAPTQVSNGQTGPVNTTSRSNTTQAATQPTAPPPTNAATTTSKPVGPTCSPGTC